MKYVLRNADDAVEPDSAAIQLHPVPSKQSLVVKVVPPRSPTAEIEHVPCDIVLVIDVSTSMDADAPVPGEDEITGLSVLDLTKHAAITIIETLNDKDRLGIVTFGTKSTTVLPLMCMEASSKEKARNKIKSLQPNGSTNLWHGIQDAIRAFEGCPNNGSARAMMVLTDGQPNHMCPPQGYIPKMKTLRPLPATLHTFGFGYDLRSGLLRSLAEYGHGNYSFIPDAGMIGTVFVHAVANLQATFAAEAVLTLSYSPSIHLQHAGEITVATQHPEKIATQSTRQMTLQIQLGNLQFGQSRDIFLQIRENTAHAVSSQNTEEIPIVAATLSYQKIGISTSSFAAARCSILEPGGISKAEIAYHQSRADICHFLSSIFPLGSDGEHRASYGTNPQVHKAALARLVAEIPAKDFKDEKNVSLMQDLTGPEPHGQISLAINDSKYFNKWGVHYLPSYSNAHSRQICNSFKDPGPLQYGVESPLFISCRDRLNDAFDNLPAPEPSIRKTNPRGVACSTFSRGIATPVSMSSFRDVSGVCFEGSTAIELASGRTVPIRRLRRRMKVRTPTGSRKVAMVLRTPVKETTLCCVGSLLVTPWHPISLDGKSWNFPAFLAEDTLRYTGRVYSVMLERDANTKSHAIRVAGAWGVTLGHGLTVGNDARAHHFFGDYNRVGKSLTRLGVDKFGMVRGRGVERDARTGLVRGLKTAATMPRTRRATMTRYISILPLRSVAESSAPDVGVDSA